jgi:hypothetical protein
MFAEERKKTPEKALFDSADLPSFDNEKCTSFFHFFGLFFCFICKETINLCQLVLQIMMPILIFPKRLLALIVVGF